jgi:cyclophilin family peptidyl-prolyl cis-trans isomerase
VEGAARLYAARGGEATVVIASGGRRWPGGVEADVIARELVARGVPEGAIVRERCSLSTRDNARFSAAALARRGLDTAALVTCEEHMLRALHCFARAGVDVEPVGVEDAATGGRLRLWQWLRERFLRVAMLGVLALWACSKKAPGAIATAPDVGEEGGVADSMIGIARAEDMRRADALPRDAQRDRDPRVRRAAARAQARILDGDASALLRALEDDDDEVVTWAGYGLGESCKGHEEPHVRALAARLASLDRASTAIPVLLRALGRCGGDTAEQTLRAWLRRGGEGVEAAAYALGDVGAARGSLSLESTAILLDAAEASPPLGAALYAFGRSDTGGGDPFEGRLVTDARAALLRASMERVFAIRALARARDPDTVQDLAHVVVSRDYSPAERAEAARALGRLRSPGQVALADALASLVPDRAEGLFGDAYGILLAAVESVAEEKPKRAESVLWALARLELGPGRSPALTRRASGVRCAAAAKLARGAWDSDVLRGCDLGDGEAGERARLTALDRGPLVKARRAAWVALTKSRHPRVCEAALELVGRHPELGDAARAALADALDKDAPGVVAVAAEVLQEHPDRVFALADSERRAALDPRAPPPTAHPARELDATIAKALRAAVAHPWAPDRVETRVALVDAALAVGLGEGRAFALAACRDDNATVRARAAKALAASGAAATSSGAKHSGCPAPDEPADPAPEIGHVLVRSVHVIFETDAGNLGIRFEPDLAPVAVTRLVALARSGFYTGIAIHRVAPGFVVQFGDRGGDGYGGSGELLRCETSPVPFGPLEVGVALAGRDTGSSQVFITLGRYPHLDGEYPWVGRADGDWNAVAEGDVVRAVRVED